MKQVVVVLTNWNGAQFTIPCLESLQRSDYANVEVIVVDDGSTDDSPALISARFPEVELLRQPQNSGLSKARNRGIQAALDRGADYILILDNDARVDRTLISHLVATAQASGDQAAVGPKIYWLHDPTRLWFAYGRLSVWTGIYSNPAYNRIDSGQFDRELEIDLAGGCCLLIPRKVIESVGGFDPSFGAWASEDVDWCLRCRGAGFRLLYCPKGKVWHHVSATAGKMDPAIIRYLSTRNQLWSLRKIARPWHVASLFLCYPARFAVRAISLLSKGQWRPISAELKGARDGFFVRVTPGSRARAGAPTGQKEPGAPITMPHCKDAAWRVLGSAFACALDPSTKFFGGGDIMAWNLVQRLSRTHRLWVLTAAQNREAIAAALEKQLLPDVQFVYVDLPGWLHALLRHQAGIQLYAYLWQWRAYFVARGLQRRIRFDLFHHLTYENDWMASIIGALLPIPYLRGPAGGAHRVPKSFRSQFPARSYWWEYARMALQWIFRHDPFFAIGQERAKVLLMANREALGALPARWRRKARLLSVNGIAGDELAPPQPQAPSEKFAVLSAGRLIPLKGFDLALRAFAIFAARRPEADFTIVGQGPEGNRLESLIHELGLEKQARIVSWMPRERLLATMRFCDVFLFASLRDGGGLVVVEAMAAGKPVVCFDLGGPGLHVNEDCGFKVPARDPEQGVRDMAAALEKLAADRSLRARMGRAAFERARQVYDWDRVADQIIQAYEKALGVSASQ